MNAKSKINRQPPAPSPALEAGPAPSPALEAGPAPSPALEAGPAPSPAPAPDPAPAPVLEISSVPGVPISGIAIGCPNTHAVLEAGAYMKSARLVCADLEIMGGATIHGCAVEIMGPPGVRGADPRARLEWARKIGDAFTHNRVDLKNSTLIIAGFTVAPRGWIANPAGALKPDPAYVRTALGAAPTGNPIKL